VGLNFIRYLFTSISPFPSRWPFKSLLIQGHRKKHGDAVRESAPNPRRICKDRGAFGSSNYILRVATLLVAPDWTHGKTNITMASHETEATPFWNVNVPPSLHTAECPDFLQYAFKNEKDKAMLSTPDSKYQRQSWPEVQQIIHDNRLDLFLRVPSDLRRYREYSAKLVREYGTVMAFVMQERLRWQSLEPRGKPFEEPGKPYASAGKPVARKHLC